jgi:Kdo2-lipid IVA lauroyltransferase/acyltransferase
LLLRAITARVALLFLHLTRLLPLRVCRLAAAVMTPVSYLLVPRLRRVGMANLDRAYGSTLTAREKRAILRGAIRNAATVAAEFAHLGKLSAAGVRAQVEIRGLEHLGNGTGCLIIGAHFGNWEWMASALRVDGVAIAEVVRPLDDPALNRAIDAVRRAHGVQTIPKDASGPEVFRLLRAGVHVGILIDQSPRASGVPVDFFGARCWATAAPAMVALRSKAPIVCVGMTRHADGRYLIEVHPPLPIRRTGNLPEDLVRITQQCQHAMEAIIKERPDHWLWIHRRWKARPRLEREWAARVTRRARAQPEADEGAS